MAIKHLPKVKQLFFPHYNNKLYSSAGFMYMPLSTSHNYEFTLMLVHLLSLPEDKIEEKASGGECNPSSGHECVYDSQRHFNSHYLLDRNAIVRNPD